MVPKADSGAFLLLFLLVLTVTEPLRPGARRGGRGVWGRGGAGRAVCGAGVARGVPPLGGAAPRRAPVKACPRAAAPPARDRAPRPGLCREFTRAQSSSYIMELCSRGMLPLDPGPWSAACLEIDGSESDVRGPTQLLGPGSFLAKELRPWGAPTLPSG